MTRITITILALVYCQLTFAQDLSDTSSDSGTGLSEKAVWLINWWDKDGDDLLDWTKNFVNRSGLPSEDTSGLVIATIDTLGILSPESIASKGGRKSAYQEMLQQSLDAVKSRGQEQQNPRDDGSPTPGSSTEENARPTIDPFELIGNTGTTSGDNEIENEEYHRSRWNVAAEEARQGDRSSQFILGAAYNNGDNRFVGPRDRVKAYICFSLAEDAGSGFAEDARKQLEAEMPANEVAKAKLEAQRWTSAIKRNSAESLD